MRQSLPLRWLLSDARNDNALSDILDGLPAESGFVFRHYHLSVQERRSRFQELFTKAKLMGNHLVILAGSAGEAREWGADGIYGMPSSLAGGNGLLRLATAHNGDELVAARAAGADGAFLSPVFPTRSHPCAPTLGVHGFNVLAQSSPIPVIALGGMSGARADELAWQRWGAIDGLVPPLSP